MSSTAEYVESLSDEALYKELKKHGIQAGPVVATTRRLYMRKLTEALENKEKHSSEDAEDDHNTSSRYSPLSSTPSPRLSYERDEIPPRLNLTYSSPVYSRSDQEDRARSRFSYLGSQDSSHLSGSSFLSNDSYRKSYSGLRDEDTFSRMRKSYTDTPTRPELPSRYRFPGLSEEHVPRLTRYNREQSKSSVRLVMCGALTLVAVIVLYVMYSIWSDNDPYRQIEEEARRILDENKT